MSYNFLSIKLYQPILILRMEGHKFMRLTTLVQNSLDVFVKKTEPAFNDGDNAAALSHKSALL